MNDLAVAALHALNVAQAEVRGRSTLSLGIAGFLVASVAAVAGSLGTAARTAQPITPWFGLLSSPGGQHTQELAGVVFLVAVAGLAGLWSAALAVVRRGRLGEAAIWRLAAAWALPFVLAPPLLDTHVYLDVARGTLQRLGLSPYDDGVGALTHATVVGAVDPSLRGQEAATGPLTVLLQHLVVAASGHSQLGAVLLLRVVCVLGFVQLGRAALALGGSRRPRALALTLLNPLVLLYVVSAAHLDGAAVAVLLTGLGQADQRRWGRAVLLCTVAGCLLPVLFVALPFVVTVHVRGRRGGSARWVAARDLVEAAVVFAAASVTVRHGFGWVGNVAGQFSEHLAYAPANALGRMMGPIVASASLDDLSAGGRVTATVATVAVVGYLLATAHRRPLDHSVGYALLGVALLAPDVYPWFLLWGIACLAPTVHGFRRRVVMLLATVGCLVDPPGFSATAGTRISVAVVIAGVVLFVLLVRRSAEPAQRPPEISRTAGRTSAR